MTFEGPAASQIRSISESLGMDLADDYIENMRAFLGQFVDGYRLIDQLPDWTPSVKYPRSAGYRPEGEENKWGAWLVKANIKGATSGKLAGKKVAVKDTYCVAGLPLTNGSTVLQG